MSKKIRPAAISPVQRKVVACHFPEAERALEVVFRKLQAEERVREEQLREALRRSGSSPLGKLESQFVGRPRD